MAVSSAGRLARLNLWLGLLLMAGVAGAQTGRIGLYRVQVTPTPQQLPADGQSQSRLRIVVRDQYGRPAPDGLQVVVSTDLGFLTVGPADRVGTLTLRTAGGAAFAALVSNTPGTATVTAQVADSRMTATVDFLPEGETIQPEQRVVDIKGKWVGYSSELSLIEARDQATARFGRLLFEVGGVLQVNVEDQTLKAQRVVIRRGDVELSGEDLYFDLGAKRGVLRRFGPEGVERVFFDAIGLHPLETQWELPLDAFRADRRESDAWFIASSISYFLREKIVLRHGSVWTGEQRVLKLPPYWIIGLPGYSGSTNAQALGVSSGGGVALDFPFFYRVTDSRTGALKIQHGAQAGAVTTRDGWSLALAEEYRSSMGAQGALELGGLPRSDWGLTWRDSRPWTKDGFASTNISTPDHKSFYADTNAYTYHGGARWGLRAYYDAPDDYEDSYGLVGDWLGDPRPIGRHRPTYRFGLTLGGKQYPDDPSPVAIAESYAELDLGQRTLGRKTRVSPSITNIYSCDTSGYGLNSLRSDWRLDHDVNSSLSLGLDYGVEWRTGDYSDASTLQTLDFDARAHHRTKWTSTVNATFDLTREYTYAYWTFSYSINPKWRWGLQGTYYDLDTSVYRDLELSLGRVVGDREIGLAYSTDTGRVWINLAGFSTQ